MKIKETNSESDHENVLGTYLRFNKGVFISRARLFNREGKGSQQGSTLCK